MGSQVLGATQRLLLGIVRVPSVKLPEPEDRPSFPTWKGEREGSWTRVGSERMGPQDLVLEATQQLLLGIVRVPSVKLPEPGDRPTSVRGRGEAGGDVREGERVEGTGIGSAEGLKV
jgi:hypothetical protein